MNFNSGKLHKRSSFKKKLDSNKKSRKERRKERRVFKKSKRNEHFQKIKGQIKISTNDDGRDSNGQFKQKGVKTVKEPDHITVKEEVERLQKHSQQQRIKQLKKANEEEDKEIKKLEKHLLLKHKRKTIPKSFSADGLDYLLEICDEDKLKAMKIEQNLQEPGSEFEEDFALMSNSQNKITAKKCRKKSTTDYAESEKHNIDKSASDDLLGSEDSETGSEESETEHMLDWRSEESETERVLDLDDSEKKSIKRSLKDECSISLEPATKKGKKIEFKSKVPKQEFLQFNKKEDIQRKSKQCDFEKEDMTVEIKESLRNERRNSKKEGNIPISDKIMYNTSFEENEADDYWEDIYGRTRDRKGNVIQVQTSKYIPPHLRTNGNSKNQEQLSKLKKQMKGLFNRLAENNLHNISSQVEELYMCHSRNDMNETLTNLLLESLVAQVLTPERLIMEHVMLVAILHANVGTEIGAHVLQTLIKKFSEHLQFESEIENKELDNIILILSHLYNFKVFNSILIYNIMDKLAETFGEKQVELILIILKTVGFSLRRDNPLALKDFILRLQQKAGEAVQFGNSNRVKFMLEILLAIKNNNMAKIPNYDVSHINHLKKLMKGFLHKGNYVTELKISLEDLLKADERGRWWIVGSAWSGLLPGQHSEHGANLIKDSPRQNNSSQYNEHLLVLARKQQMNTDVRKDIFCILMAAEDFLDAFEKLLHLGLKNQQEREIIYVLIHCCLQEKEFNPFYCLLAQKFCDFDRKYQIVIQCALWDKFKEFQNMSSLQITNLAKFYLHLVLEQALPLSILKVIHFAEVDKITVRFLRKVLLGILLHHSAETIHTVFQRIAISQKLHLFREGMRLFIHHFILRNLSSHSSVNVELLKIRAKMADKILSAAESKVKF